MRGLSPSGWEAALDHGVRRLIDLRFEGEGHGETSPPEGVGVVAVSLFGQHDPDVARAFDERVRNEQDVAAVFAAGYIDTLANRSDRVATAVAAVADADHADAVVIHCVAGKDRTGIVSALLLGVADVPDQVVADDYAESGPNMEAIFVDWLTSAGNTAELEFRRRLVEAPAETMMAVLSWLRHSAGGAAGYLRRAGLTEAQISRLRVRMVEPA